MAGLSGNKDEKLEKILREERKDFMQQMSQMIQEGVKSISESKNKINQAQDKATIKTVQNIKKNSKEISKAQKEAFDDIYSFDYKTKKQGRIFDFDFFGKDAKKQTDKLKKDVDILKQEVDRYQKEIHNIQNSVGNFKVTKTSKSKDNLLNLYYGMFSEEEVSKTVDGIIKTLGIKDTKIRDKVEEQLKEREKLISAYNKKQTSLTYEVGSRSKNYDMLYDAKETFKIGKLIKSIEEDLQANGIKLDNIFEFDEKGFLDRFNEFADKLTSKSILKKVFKTYADQINAQYKNLKNEINTQDSFNVQLNLDDYPEIFNEAAIKAEKMEREIKEVNRGLSKTGKLSESVQKQINRINFGENTKVNAKSSFALEIANAVKHGSSLTELGLDEDSKALKVFNKILKENVHIREAASKIEPSIITEDITKFVENQTKAINNNTDAMRKNQEVKNKNKTGLSRGSGTVNPSVERTAEEVEEEIKQLISGVNGIKNGYAMINSPIAELVEKWLVDAIDRIKTNKTSLQEEYKNLEIFLQEENDKLTKKNLAEAYEHQIGNIYGALDKNKPKNMKDVLSKILDGTITTIDEAMAKTESNTEGLKYRLNDVLKSLTDIQSTYANLDNVDVNSQGSDWLKTRIDQAEYYLKKLDELEKQNGTIVIPENAKKFTKSKNSNSDLINSLRETIKTRQTEFSDILSAIDLEKEKADHEKKYSIERLLSEISKIDGYDKERDSDIGRFWSEELKREIVDVDEALEHCRDTIAGRVAKINNELAKANFDEFLSVLNPDDFADINELFNLSSSLSHKIGLGKVSFEDAISLIEELKKISDTSIEESSSNGDTDLSYLLDKDLVEENAEETINSIKKFANRLSREKSNLEKILRDKQGDYLELRNDDIDESLKEALESDWYDSKDELYADFADQYYQRAQELFYDRSSAIKEDRSSGDFDNIADYDHYLASMADSHEKCLKMIEMIEDVDLRSEKLDEYSKLRAEDIDGDEKDRTRSLNNGREALQTMVEDFTKESSELNEQINNITADVDRLNKIEVKQSWFEVPDDTVPTSDYKEIEKENKELEDKNNLLEQQVKIKKTLKDIALQEIHEGNVTDYDPNDFSYSRTMLNKYADGIKNLQRQISQTTDAKILDDLNRDLEDAKISFVSLYNVINDSFDGKLDKKGSIKSSTRDLYTSVIGEVAQFDTHFGVGISSYTTLPLTEESSVSTDVAQKEQVELQGELVETRKEAEKTAIKLQDVVYHAGIVSKLNKAESNGKFYGSNRGTGFYGTGHYFVDAATRHELDNNSNYSKLPYTSVDISQYDNLFKATTDEIAGKLHEFLRNLTRFTQGIDDYNVSELFGQFKRVFGDTVMSIDDFESKINELTVFMQNSDHYDRSDSISTQFMKSLGYGGVDTRGTRYADTRYGTVIYDLKEESILQANITDELQKQGDMLERLNYQKGEVFDKSEDSRIQNILDQQAYHKEITEESNRLFDHSKLNKYQDELDIVNQKLSDNQQIIYNCQRAIDNADDEADRFSKEMEMFGFEPKSEQEKQEYAEDLIKSYKKRIDELNKENELLNKHKTLLDDVVNQEEKIARIAYEKAKQNVNNRRSGNSVDLDQQELNIEKEKLVVIEQQYEMQKKLLLQENRKNISPKVKGIKGGSHLKHAIDMRDIARHDLDYDDDLLLDDDTIVEIAEELLKEAEASSSVTDIIVANNKKQQKSEEETAKITESATEKIIAANKKKAESEQEYSRRIGIETTQVSPIYKHNEEDLNKIDLSNFRILKQHGQIGVNDRVVATYQNAFGQIATALYDEAGNMINTILTTDFKDLTKQVKNTMSLIAKDTREMEAKQLKYGDKYDSTAIKDRISSNKDLLQLLFEQSRIYADDDKYKVEADQFLKDYTAIRESINSDMEIRKASIEAQLKVDREKDDAKLAAAKSKYTEKLSSVNDVFKNTTQYASVQQAINDLNGVDTVSLDKVNAAFNLLHGTINDFKQDVKSSASLDPVFAAIKKKNNIENIVTQHQQEFEKIGYSAEEAKEKVEGLFKISEKIKNIDINKTDGISSLGEQLKLFNLEEDRLKGILTIEKNRQQIQDKRDKNISKSEYSGQIKDYEQLLNEQLKEKGVEFEDAVFKSSNVDSSGKTVLTFIEVLGDKVRETKVYIDDANEALDLLMANDGKDFDIYSYKAKSNYRNAKISDFDGIDENNYVQSVIASYKELSKTEKQYQTLRASVENGTATDKQKADYEILCSLRERYNSIIAKQIVLDKEEQLYYDQVGKSKIEQEERKYRARQEIEQGRHDVLVNQYHVEDVDSAYEEATRINNALNNTKQLMDQIATNDLDGFSAIFDSAQKEVEELNTALKVGNIDTDGYTAQIQKIANELNNVVAVLPAGLDDVEGELKKIANSLPNAEIGEYDDINKTLKVTLDKGKGTIQEVTLEYEQLNGAVSKSKSVTKQAETSWSSFFKSLKKRAQSLIQYLMTFVSFYEVISWIRRGVTVVRDLDAALTEMRKVSDETTASLKNFQKVSFDIAENIGSTAVQIQNSAADFMRLGYSLQEASTLAKDANIYANVGDMEIDEATEHMISSIKAWSSEFNSEVEASAAIVDRYNEIGNNFAISSADIGSAMERSAAALKAGGNTLNESLGLIVSGNIIQQDAETTAAALKIMSLRIRGSKTDLEEMGESTDGLASSTSKLRDEIKALTGVDIMLDESTYKSTAQIIQEIGAVWDKLSDVSQAAALEKLAGKNRASTVAGLLENYETIEKVIESAENAEGSALQENERYLESIQGRIDLLTNRLQEFWYNLLDSEMVKEFVDMGTQLIGVLDNVLSGITDSGALNLATTALSLFVDLLDAATSSLGQISTWLTVIGGNKLWKMIKGKSTSGGRVKTFTLNNMPPNRLAERCASPGVCRNDNICFL